MNCLLALDLSTPHGHVALVRDGVVVCERRFTSNRSHNSMLYAPLGEALEAAGGELSGIVIGTGPGSYTGVRISIAAAHGLAVSRKVPVVGLPSITALSDAHEHVVVGDARRGKFYAAHIREGVMQGDLALLDETAVRAWLRDRETLPRFASDATPPLGEVSIQLAQPNAVLLAMHALRQQPKPSDLIEPLYVQEAFITKAKTPTMGATRPSSL